MNKEQKYLSDSMIATITTNTIKEARINEFTL